MAADGFRAADWMAAQFESYGLATVQESWDPQFFPNVIATLPGLTLTLTPTLTLSLTLTLSAKP
jgi:hypothetical protein